MSLFRQTAAAKAARNRNTLCTACLLRSQELLILVGREVLADGHPFCLSSSAGDCPTNL